MAWEFVCQRTTILTHGVRIGETQEKISLNTTKILFFVPMLFGKSNNLRIGSGSPTKYQFTLMPGLLFQHSREKISIYRTRRIVHISLWTLCIRRWINYGLEWVLTHWMHNIISVLHWTQITCLKHLQQFLFHAWLLYDVCYEVRKMVQMWPVVRTSKSQILWSKPRNCIQPWTKNPPPVPLLQIILWNKICMCWQYFEVFSWTVLSQKSSWIFRRGP